MRVGAVQPGRTLVVHLVDRNTNQLVWQGTASKVLENPKNAEKTIQKQLRKFLQSTSLLPLISRQH